MKSGDVSIRMPRTSNVCPPGSPNLRLALVVLSIGAASHFLLYLDSVVDNLLPAAMPFLMTIYKTKEDADLAWEVMVSSRIYGLAFGCFLSILLSYRSGRKFPILLGTILDAIGVLLTLLMMYVPMGISTAIIGRFINGCGQGIVQTAGSVMVAELPPIKKRGTALATLTMWACLGELGGMLISLENFLGRPSTWHWAMAIPLVPLLPALYILFKAPESPRYLFMRNCELEARKAMLYYQSPSDAKLSTEEIIEELKLSIGDVDENGNTPKKILNGWPIISETLLRIKDGKFIRPLLIALFVQSFVHLDDWLWISYSTQIFENHGLRSGQAQRASLLMSLPQAIISIVLLGCFDNFKRRFLLIMPTVLSIIAGILAIGFISFEQVLRGGVSAAVILPILAAIDLSAAAISGESAFAIVPELFLPEDKILGTAIVGIAQNIFGGILTSFLLTAINKAGTGKVLVPFVMLNMVYVIVNYKYLPETAEKTPQEVASNFSQDCPGARICSSLKRIYSQLSTTHIPTHILSLGSALTILVFFAQVFACVILIHVALGLYYALTGFL